MVVSSSEHDVLRRYLLGSSTAAARDSIETQLFSQDQIFWERVRAAEEALIDEYVWDELDADEKRGFENHFLLSAERRARVEFARALRDHARLEPSHQRSTGPWLRRLVYVPAWSVAAALILLLLVPGLVWRQYVSTPRTDTEVSVWLTSSSSRVRSTGPNLTRVVLPAGCRLLHIRLDAGSGKFARYRATLHDVDGREIWSQNQLTAADADRRVGVTVTLPCDLLPEGDYYFQLHGLAEGAAPVVVDRYDVRVLHEE